MARPLKHPTGPVVTVRDLDSGEIGSWCFGLIRPVDSHIARNAHAAAERGQEYCLMGVWVKCDLSTPVGATAALCQGNPGRTQLIEAPDGVRAVLQFPESGLSSEEPEVHDV
ncbi:hypothetical protein [Pseudarthrobacter phenanthrenivorans]|uniref:Uncharacterized protein n=1 Tax=Pseudarthrobacter phenanthrenivorans TaxID=361575 RepID=A0A0B4DPQ8_PSEPS|nr:hypothetical protein [Pseudarthrobacter phenanthrenivorans]KIC68686.1 hypothetical protein RM50_04260 [Pseudarthrobacter phenanthrenivorans]